MPTASPGFMKLAPIAAPALNPHLLYAETSEVILSRVHTLPPRSCLSISARIIERALLQNLLSSAQCAPYKLTVYTVSLTNKGLTRRASSILVSQRSHLDS